MPKKLCQALLPVPFDYGFSYFVPEDLLVEIGDVVKVSFRNKEIFGVVIGFDQKNDIDEKKIKTVISKNEKIKELGLKAKYRVLELLLSPPKNIIEIMGITNKQIIDIFDKDVYIINIECGDFDKYGRLLANVFINDGRSIASVLLEEKLAYKYDGKTKLTEEEQFNFLL